MPFGSVFGGALLAAATLSYAAPLTIYSGGPEDLIIEEETTLNATTPAGQNYAPTLDSSTSFQLSFTNVMSTTETIYAYCMGKDDNGQLAFLNANGSDFYFPTTNSSTPVAIDQSQIAIPLGSQGSTVNVTVPGFLDSARVYFSVGPMQQYVVRSTDGFPGQVQSDVGNPNDPNNNVSWAFMEFNWANDSGIFADISAVDLVGLPLGIVLETSNGTQQALGLSSTSVQDVCSALKTQAAVDSQPWDELCVYLDDDQSELIRVVGPQHYSPASTSDGATAAAAFENYFQDYVDDVFAAYASTPLTFDLTQQGYGAVNCTTSGGDNLTCAGEALTFPKPSDADIFGCASGPFAIPEDADGLCKSIVPMLCAGFQRSTLLLPSMSNYSLLGVPAAGALQPSLPISSYYSGSGPFNWYSKIAHANEWNGMGYAFPYDDVDSMNGGGVAGTVSAGDVVNLQVVVGGYDLMQG